MRHRNFLPAKIGIWSSIVFIITPLYYAIIYQLPTITNTQVNSGSRAYMISIYMDIFDCLLKPLVVILGAPSIKIKNVLNSK